MGGVGREVAQRCSGERCIEVQGGREQRGMISHEQPSKTSIPSNVTHNLRRPNAHVGHHMSDE